MKRGSIILAVCFILGVSIISGCATTGSAYAPDPSIPKEKLATLKVVDRDTHVVSVDGIQIKINNGGSILIEPGKHTIEIYSDEAKRIMEIFIKGGFDVSYIEAMEINASEGAVYEVYTIRETSVTGSMQSSSYKPDIREAAK